MDDNIFNPRKRLLTDKETVELIEIIESVNDKLSKDSNSDKKQSK